MIELKSLPMPPIANHRLMPSNGRLIKSPEIRNFDQRMQMYILKMRSKVFDTRKLAKEWIDIGYCLKVDLNFYWPKEKLISKQHLPKRLDLDGRIKSTLDAISDVIGIDDKFVIEINARKLYWEQPFETIDAKISPIFWKDLSHDC